jgi:Acetyltransferase (GNAT) domain
MLQDAASFVQIWDEITSLQACCGAEGDRLLSPLHFLAGTCSVRRSCSVGCWDGQRLVGIFYATAQYFCGVNTGYAVAGDFAGRGSLLCRPEDEIEVIEAAVSAIFAARIHSLHIRLMPRVTEKAQLGRFALRCVDSLVPSDLIPLAGSFDEFLATLGKLTRRNMRSYMRKAEEAGITFVPELSCEEYNATLERLNRNSRFPAKSLQLARDERWLTLHGGGSRMGLRSGNGSLIAILCGFRTGDRFYLLSQLNDSGYANSSLSLTLRGLAVQHLIATGHRELVFVGASSANIGRFCVPAIYRSMLIDRKGGVTAAGKRACAWLTAFLDRRGVPSQIKLQMLCGGYLDEQLLRQWTMLERDLKPMEDAHKSLAEPLQDVGAGVGLSVRPSSID